MDKIMSFKYILSRFLMNCLICLKPLERLLINFRGILLYSSCEMDLMETSTNKVTLNFKLLYVLRNVFF